MLGMDKVSENLAEEKQTKMNALMNEGMDAGQAEQLSEGTRLRDTSIPGDVDYRSGGGLMGPDPLQLRNDLLKFKKGGKVPAYMAGGIGKLGAKVIKNLVGKLSNKELKMILDTSFKGTNPSKSPAKIRQNKLLEKLGPDKYRYRNVKSEVYE